MGLPRIPGDRSPRTLLAPNSHKKSLDATDIAKLSFRRAAKFMCVVARSLRTLSTFLMATSIRRVVSAIARHHHHCRPASGPVELRADSYGQCTSNVISSATQPASVPSTLCHTSLSQNAEELELTYRYKSLVFVKPGLVKSLTLLSPQSKDFASKVVSAQT